MYIGGMAEISGPPLMCANGIFVGRYNISKGENM